MLYDDIPLISIIIPVYNVVDYLSKCLDSVINQTYKNLQIIVVDDGSTDGSFEIIKKYAEKDKRIFVIHQENMGVSAARNLGLTYANGKYIGFVDSDDWISPDMYMYMYLYQLMIKNDADISSVEIYRTVCERNLDYKLSQEKIQVFKRDEYLKYFFKIDSQETVYYVFNKLYKRELFPENLFPAYAIGEDVFATYKMILNSNLIVTSNVDMYFYRQNSGITASFNEKYFGLIKLWDELDNWTKREYPQFAEFSDINRRRINFTVLSEMAIAGCHTNRKYDDEIRKMVAQLRKDKRILLKSNIAVSRKAIILLFCINYRSTAFILHKFVRKRQ